MDIQLISDDYSCAVYMVEYVNKSNRGMGDLHRKLRELSEKNSNADHITLIREVAKKFLNSIDMSVQEAAWFLLQQPMSSASRIVIYIPQDHGALRIKIGRKNNKWTMNRLGMIVLMCGRLI